jgi:hypothetical protein
MRKKVDDAENANGNGSEWKATEDDEGGWPRTVGIAELFHNHGRFRLSVRPLVSTSTLPAILGTMQMYRWYDSILYTVIISQALTGLSKHARTFSRSHKDKQTYVTRAWDMKVQNPEIGVDVIL